MGQNSSTGKITVAMTIHSPTAAAFSLFDRLFVLVRGRLVFFGTAGECISHFERVNGRALAMGDNPSEFILDIIVAADAKDQGLELSSAYQEVTDGVEKALSLRQGTFIQSSAADLQPITLASIAQMKRFKSSFATPWWYQIFVLIRFRGLRSYSDLGWVLPRALERVLFAVFMTVLYVNTVQNFNPSTDATTLAAFLYLLTAATGYSVVNFIYPIASERPLFNRERNDGLYSPAVYLTYKLIEELGIQWCIGLINQVIMFASILSGSPGGWSRTDAFRSANGFLFFYLMLGTATSGACSAAYAVVAFVGNATTASIAASSLFAVLGYLAGFVILQSQTPWYLRWITYINPLRYLWCGLMQMSFSNLSNSDNAYVMGNLISPLAYFEAKQIGMWPCLAVQIGFFFFWAVLAFLALRFIKHEQR